jgi:putative SOS response-associated peptidase YedK
MLLPAIYNYSPIPDIETGELRGTFSIITRSANELMKQIHNEGVNNHRMPVFMEPKQALQWINEDLTDNHIIEFLQYEISANELLAHPVYMIRTTKERPDGKEKYEKYDYGVKMEELLFT